MQITDARSTGLLCAALLLSLTTLTGAPTATGTTTTTTGTTTAATTATDGTTTAAAATAPGAPNVVLITSDDQTLSEMKWLPKTRRLLGRAGVTFDEMITPHPNCCPSRAQLLTGQYAQNNGVRTNSPPWGGHEALHLETALPVWLQRAGYRTGFVGKYLHGYDQEDGMEVGWDHWKPIIGRLSDYYDFTQYDDGRLTRSDPGAYHTDTVAAQTRAMVTEFAGQDAPFFVWSSFIAPHGTCWRSEEKDCSAPPRPAERYASAYPGATLPDLSSPAINERGMGDKPPQLRHRDPVSRSAMRALVRARAQSLASLDDAVAGIVRTLRRTGELRRTLIVFTSDNGYLFGQHRQTGKVLAYEESLRVPLLMRGPGIPAGEHRAQTVATIDLAPTIADATGARPLVTVDGRSLLPYARDDRAQGPRTLLVQAGSNRGTTSASAWQFQGVRTDRYTLVRWRRPGFVELYDRRRDPHQLRNVAGRPAYAAVRRSLSRALRTLADCSGASCRARPR